MYSDSVKPVRFYRRLILYQCGPSSSPVIPVEQIASQLGTFLGYSMKIGEYKYLKIWILFYIYCCFENIFRFRRVLMVHRSFHGLKEIPVPGWPSTIGLKTLHWLLLHVLSTQRGILIFRLFDALRVVMCHGFLGDDNVLILEKKIFREYRVFSSLFCYCCFSHHFLFAKYLLLNYIIMCAIQTIAGVLPPSKLDVCFTSN